MNCFLGNSANLAEVACHELGHAIGLDHSPDLNALMFATARGHGRDATLGADDKQGVLSIYPANGGPNPSGPPRVSRVKVKTQKKIVVYGENFGSASVAVLNGSFISPKSSSFGKLTVKGTLNLRPEGANTLYVISGGLRSSTFIF